MMRSLISHIHPQKIAEHCFFHLQQHQQQHRRSSPTANVHEHFHERNQQQQSQSGDAKKSASTADTKRQSPIRNVENSATPLTNNHIYDPTATPNFLLSTSMALMLKSQQRKQRKKSFASNDSGASSTTEMDYGNRETLLFHDSFPSHNHHNQHSIIDKTVLPLSPTTIAAASIATA